MNLVSTGVEGLDSILNGGIPEGSIVELSGVPGSGKTIIALQFLINTDEPGLFVSLEQNRANLEKQVETISQKIPDNVSVLLMENNNLEGVLSDIESAVKTTNAKRIVIDSLTALISSVMTPEFSRQLSESTRMSVGGTTILPLFIDSEPQVRSIVWAIITRLRKIGCTTLLTSELSHNSEYYSRDTISEFKVDGIILLDAKLLGDRLEKTIQVAKMRYVNHEAEPYLLSVSPKGVSVSKLYGIEEK